MMARGKCRAGGTIQGNEIKRQNVRRRSSVLTTSHAKPSQPSRSPQKEADGTTRSPMDGLAWLCRITNIPP